MSELPNATVRKLKAAAQRLEPIAKVGRAGLSEEFLKNLDTALATRELIKIRFDEFKDEKHELATQIAEKTKSHLVWIIGHVAVFYRPKTSEPGADISQPSM
jgi:RNA-binding protein